MARILLVAVGAIGALVLAGVASAQPQVPATFYGTASIDGEPAPAGAEVRALIEGEDCTQPGGQGVVIDSGVAVYVITVMHESQREGCGADGKTVTFTIGGQQAGQAVAWRQGVEELNLNAGNGQPMPLPSVLATPGRGATAAHATATEAAKFTPRAGAVPTDDIVFGKTPGVLQPASTETESGSGFPVLGIVLIAVVVLAAAGGAAGIALSRRRQ